MKKLFIMLLMIVISMVSFAQVRARVAYHPVQHRHYMHHRNYVRHRHYVRHRRPARRGTHVVLKARL